MNGNFGELLLSRLAVTKVIHMSIKLKGAFPFIQTSFIDIIVDL